MAGNSTGYGPSRFQRLVFSGNPDNYKIWKTKFLAYLRTQKLKSVIVEEAPTEPTEAVATYNSKNEEVYAELVQCLDDKSLGRVMREAENDGKKAIGILRAHYQGNTKPRIVSLYMQLINIQMEKNENVTSYIIWAEKIIGALERAKEVPSGKLLISILLKGLPPTYRQFSIHVTQSREDISLSKFKVALKGFEETDCCESHVSPKQQGEDTILKVADQKSCYGCGSTQHLVKDSDHADKMCKYRKGAKHFEKDCNRHKMSKDRVNITTDKYEADLNHTFSFCIAEGIKKNGIIVDTGSTSHAVNKDSFIKIDPDFKPANHCIELADGKKMYGSALKRGDAKICLIDSQGRSVDAILTNALYCPTYPQSILSVKVATSNGFELGLCFKEDGNWMKKDRVIFDFEVRNGLYYLKVDENTDSLNLSIDHWHKVLGHCNHKDIMKLKDVSNGMIIDNESQKKDFTCNVCVEGKFVNTRHRKPDQRAKGPLDLIHADLSGPTDPTGKDGFKYVISFVDDFSSLAFVYFLRVKTDSIIALKQFLADCSQFGRVMRLRCDNGGEFTSQEFTSLLRDKGIKQEFTSPESTHQNGTAERYWRTLFEMARCLLLEANLPKHLWTYAVKTAAYIRNRCYNKRLQKTPFETFTGKKPNLANMHIFGSPCYAYVHETKKLDSKGKQGIFVGYNHKSPAYLVYYPHSGMVQRARLIKMASEFTTYCIRKLKHQKIVRLKITLPVKIRLRAQINMRLRVKLKIIQKRENNCQVMISIRLNMNKEMKMRQLIPQIRLRPNLRRQVK
ncbi:hypothetical protein HOLleu_16202 [Holothuria leucospilota]|uniref:Integrase catalytic domain-containing protein n=1 Tax=Holothuria leucospilota TaxID=206669 RepID=A0A9Q1C5Z6_HOLLE|nr:hypothetical protein HOLleu_16202 [Holothuria leucospilota]